MTARLIDGQALALRIRQEAAQRAQKLNAIGISPALAVVLVGQDPASEIYVRNKIKACHDSGVQSIFHRYPDSLTEADLLQHIHAMNADPKIHGILVQLPLPSHINSLKIIEAIAPHKDIDGFHMSNAGALLVNQPLFRPCTPYGCMKMLESIACDPTGLHAVVVGASNIVGKPMALMLLHAGATVTLCHSKTQDLSAHTRQADILVSAAGKPKLITADKVKPGAIVIDIGINRDASGKLCGDVDFENVKEIASWITPVPGGVGPMTIAMLLTNTLEATERAAKNFS